MLQFKVQPHRHAPARIEVVGISNDAPMEPGWITHHDITSFEHAEEIAEAASKFAGIDYLAFDRGSHCYPRFGVMEAPKQLDPVSYSFNGDSYPCGYIKSVSPSFKKIVTTTGATFYRRKQSGAWLMNRTWSLIPGHIEERNPHF